MFCTVYEILFFYAFFKIIFIIIQVSKYREFELYTERPHFI